MNLTKHDKTRFLERGFVVVENAGHSLRLIDRNDAHHAISIKWEDLSALRELITLALDDGPMVIGVDTSGQAAQNAAASMRSACVDAIKSLRAVPRGLAYNNAINDAIHKVESLSIQEQEK